MTDVARFALVVGTALLALACVWRFAVIEHRMAWERTRNRIAADERRTARCRTRVVMRVAREQLRRLRAQVAPLDYGGRLADPNADTSVHYEVAA